MPIKLFITGTDTNAGKTYVSQGLLRAFNRRGLSTLGLKPLASGCHEENQHLYNPDALLLQHASSIKLPYHHINPFAFKEAIAPHIAAKSTGVDLTLEQLDLKMRPSLETAADVCVIEGAGGWYTPLNETETMADFATRHRFHIILVVRVQLGCINHALLTERAIHSANLPLAGWIANCLSPHIDYGDEQIAALKKWLTSSHLGTVHYNDQPENTLDMEMINPLTFIS